MIRAQAKALLVRSTPCVSTSGSVSPTTLQDTAHKRMPSNKPIATLLLAEPHVETVVQGREAGRRWSFSSAGTLCLLIVLCGAAWELPPHFYISWNTFCVIKRCIDSMSSQLYSKGKGDQLSEWASALCIWKGECFFSVAWGHSQCSFKSRDGLK